MTLVSSVPQSFPAPGWQAQLFTVCNQKIVKRTLSRERWPCIKTPNPICRLFLKIDLLTGFAALCLPDFIDWRYIHSCELLPPWTRDYTCVLLPLYLLSDFPPSQTKYTVYTDSVWLREGRGGGLNCAVHHILQEFYTLFLTRFRTYQIASPPQTKWQVKTTLRDWCL